VPNPPHVPWKRWLTEFLVIAVGVAVALAGDAAWEARSESIREDAYLERLSAELDLTGGRLAHSLRTEEDLAGAARTLSVALNARTLPPDDSLSFMLERALGAAGFFPVLGTARALVESGDLAILEDDALKGSITSYLQAADQIVQYLDRNTEHLFGQLLIELNRRVNRVVLTGEAESNRVPLHWDLLAVDAAFHGDIATLSIYARNRLATLRAFEAELGSMRQALRRVPQ
jgi:hypothetical protein